ncbi:MAG: TrkA family potassium uptake protein [Labilithrix sp.]|nr:TrkA family potassium uptake protein [Labilithrix sp.]MCW5816441.1 TrkA family potassium uptake protein [Labilithrix sp.]
MKIVIAGAGRGGLNLAVYLQTRGHSVVVLERDAQVVKQASEAHGIVMLAGDATDATVLKQAEPDRADAVLAMLYRDADNLGCALLARTLGAKRVLVRMRDPGYRGVYTAAGIHEILSETEILVGALGIAIEFDAVRHSMVLGTGTGETIAFEMTIPEGAWVVGKTLGEIAQANVLPASCVVAGMSHDGKLETPRGGSTFEAGMHVLLVSARDDLAAAIDLFRRADR